MWLTAEEQVDFGSVSRDFSGAQVLLHTAAGEVLSVSASDYKCLDLLLRAPTTLTAGGLAEASGLTTGCVTGVVDRLERLGLVHRVRDPADRRRVLLTPADGVEDRFTWLFEPLRRAVDELVQGQFDDRERDAIRRYLIEATRLIREHTVRLREDAPARAWR
ncbi:MarR family winged helix-turn-helix transcriptional regulator [Kutzneria sp. NPDC052558]|uniref:MarR family winged helix-turn-helix transcriptional regulator n=1 Tax=Kutzneria sp. NPDC052558 TaxID=3364121 RepID=UPI0037CA0448